MSTQAHTVGASTQNVQKNYAHQVPVLNQFDTEETTYFFHSNKPKALILPVEP